jgi:hypothetical protein
MSIPNPHKSDQSGTGNMRNYLTYYCKINADVNKEQNIYYLLKRYKQIHWTEVRQTSS